MITRCRLHPPVALLTMLAPRRHPRALDVGVFVASGTCRVGRTAGRDRARPASRSPAAAQCGAAAGSRIRLPRNGVGRVAIGCAALPGGGRSVCCTSPRGRRPDLELRRAGHRVDGRVAFRRQHLQPHTHRVSVRELQQRRGAPGDLDQPMRRRGTAVVDAHQSPADRSPGWSAARLREAAASDARRRAPSDRTPRHPRSASACAVAIDGGEAGLLAFVALARIVPDATGLVGRAEHVVRVAGGGLGRTPHSTASGRAQRPASRDDGVPEQADRRARSSRRDCSDGSRRSSHRPGTRRRPARRAAPPRPGHRARGNARPSAGRTPSRIHSPTGRRLSRPVASRSKPGGSVTGWPQGSPPRQPDWAR